MNIFDRINAWIEDAESSLITFATVVIPWIAPLLPAYLTGHHLIADIGIPWWVAVPMAVTVELLGLSAIATAFAAMRHNKRKDNRAAANRVSLAFPIGAYVFYIAVVLITNVVLSLPLEAAARPYVYSGVIALLTLISAPAFVIAVARQQQREIDREVTATKLTKTDRALPKNDSLSAMTVDDIMRQYGVSERTAYRKKAQARRNGHGVKL